MNLASPPEHKREAIVIGGGRVSTEMSEDLKKLLAEIEKCPDCKTAKAEKGVVIIIQGSPIMLYMCKKHNKSVISCWLEWIEQGKP